MMRVGSLSQSRLPTSSRFSRSAEKAAYEMRKLMQVSLSVSNMEQRWILSLLASAMISIALLLLANLTWGFRGYQPVLSVQRSRYSNQLQSTLEITNNRTMAILPPPPKLAYLISGTKGDGRRMQRLLRALYHPHNYYLLHLDLEAPMRERAELVWHVKKQLVYEEVMNVFVIGKSNLVTYRGPTMVAATLHGAAILLRKAKDWDWFINLSASDYPLVTQDDLLHVFSYLPKDLNFIEHTSALGWKE